MKTIFRFNIFLLFVIAVFYIAIKIAEKAKTIIKLHINILIDAI